MPDPAVPGLESLPALSELDALKGASDTHVVDVAAPLLSEGTAFSGSSLDFTSPADSVAWAIYRVDPLTPLVLSADGTTAGPLWLLAADYSVGNWRWTAAPEESSCTAALDDPQHSPFSDDELVYLAVICPPGSAASLTSLTVEYTPGGVYPPIIDVSQPDRIIVSWLDTGLFDYFELYRSTVPDDPAPYLIHTQDTSLVYPETGEWFYHDMIPLDGSEWLPVEQDNGTPGDPSDDFPAVAPGVDYYYQVVPYYGPGEPSVPSEESLANHPWGDRRTSRREPPATTDEILVFADQLLPQHMNSAQIQWCAENLVGTQKITKSQADQFRQHNPDFMVAGYHLGNGAGQIGNVHGDAWDADADWPWVDRHEGWFIHRPESTQPGQRVYQQTWAWYVTDPQSEWQDYLAANLLQMLGEDHYDGWFIDSCCQPWGTDPAQWWPDEETMFGYWTPRLHSMLGHVCNLADAHPLQPYIVPNAGSYVTTLSDIRYYDTEHDPPQWACDGIMIEGHAHSSPDSYYAEADWVLQHDRILEHQAQGLATILQTNIFTPDTQDRIFVMASYLLVKGDYTYINWLGDDGLDTIWPSVGQWYPEFDLDEDDFPWGAATGDPPETMADLYVAQYDEDGTTCGPFYRRGYGIGFVVVNPSDSAVNYRAPWHMSYLSVSGGGNVTEAGEKTGSYSWEMLGMGETVNMPAHSALIIRDVFG